MSNFIAIHKHTTYGKVVHGETLTEIALQVLKPTYQDDENGTLTVTYNPDGYNPQVRKFDYKTCKGDDLRKWDDAADARKGASNFAVNQLKRYNWIVYRNNTLR